MKVERAHERDYDELLDVIIRCFRSDTPEHPRFETFLPDLYRRTEADMNRHFILREAGRIISAVGVYPMSLRCGDVSMTVAGVGAVCTVPEHRGRGCMSNLLKQVRTGMIHDGYAISWLSGLRERYGRFGWEKAGSDIQIKIEGGRADQGAGSWRIRRMDAERDSIDRLAQAHDGVRWAGVCERPILRLKLQRYGMETWEAEAETGYAYVVLNRWKKWIAEWGGSPTGVEALLQQQLLKGETWAVRIPRERDGYTDLFRGLGSEVTCEHDNLAVVDLKKLAKLYHPVLADRFPQGEAVVLAVDDALCPSEVCLCGGEVSTHVPETAHRLVLDARRMALLLFGPSKPSDVVVLPAGLKWLDDIFPLPFYTPSLWRV